MLSELASGLDRFPRELLPIIANYAKERHAWRSSMEDEPYVTIDNNTVTVNGSPTTVYRIRSTVSIVDGPKRWKLDVQFNDTRFGCIAAGVTTDADGYDLLIKTIWRTVASETDFLVETHCCPFWTAGGPVSILHDGDTAVAVDGNLQLRRCNRMVLTFDLDVDRRTMVVTDDDDDDNADSLRLTVNLPAVAADAFWRPCVIICGRLTATILPA